MWPFYHFSLLQREAAWASRGQRTKGIWYGLMDAIWHFILDIVLRQDSSWMHRTSVSFTRGDLGQIQYDITYGTDGIAWWLV